MYLSVYQGQVLVALFTSKLVAVGLHQEMSNQVLHHGQTFKQQQLKILWNKKASAWNKTLEFSAIPLPFQLKQ